MHLLTSSSGSDRSLWAKWMCVCLRLSHRVSAKLTSFEVTGLPRDHVAPILLSSRRVAVDTENPLLTLMFETNPLDGSADQKLHADAQPLEIIYDAVCLLIWCLSIHLTIKPKSPRACVCACVCVWCNVFAFLSLYIYICIYYRKLMEYCT